MYDEGEYQGKIETIRVTVAGSGNPQMEVVCFIDDRTRRTVYLPLTDNARAAFVDETLEFCGFNGNFEAPEFSQEFYDDFALPLWCKHDSYRGETKEKWNISRGGGGSKNEAADNSIIARLNASWKATHKGGKPSAPPPKPKKSAPPPPKKQDNFGKDEAWAQIAEACAKAGTQPDTDTWQKCIDEVGPDEDQFGPDEWRQVAGSYPPF